MEDPIPEVIRDGTGSPIYRHHLPKLNLPLLEEIVFWAIEEAKKKARGEFSHWEQSSWMETSDCGTACCLYGKAADVSGVVELEEVISGCTCGASSCSTTYKPKALIDHPFREEPFESYDWRAIGDWLFGLSPAEGHSLSHGENTIFDVVLIAQDIIESRDEYSPLLDISVEELGKELDDLRKERRS